MKKLFLFAMLLLPVLVHAQAWSGILPASRAGSWNLAGLPSILYDGVTNGETVPNPWTPPTRIQCGSTIAAGTSAATINTAIQACAAGTYVLLGAGTFNISTTILATKNGVSIRGSGADKTILLCAPPAGPSSCISTSPGGGNPNTTWTGGFSQGTTSLTVSSVSAMTIGQTIITLGGQGSGTDTGGPWVCATTTTCITGSGSPQVYENHLVAGCDGVTTPGHACTSAGSPVIISPAIVYPAFSLLSTFQVFWITPSIGVGIEDMTFDCTSDPNPGCVGFASTYGSWFKGNRILNGNGNGEQLAINYNLNTLISNNYITQGVQILESFTYRITGFNLMMNNIIGAGGGFIQSGGGDDVYAYNLLRDAYNNGGQYFVDNTMSNHTAGYSNVLLEGNEMGNWQEDNVHGTANLNTFFRNIFYGNDPPYKNTANTFAEAMLGVARMENSVGNVLGLNQTSYICTPSACGPNFVIGLGAGNGTVHDSLSVTTAMLWGNYDIITGAVRWCGNSSSPGWATTCASTSEVQQGLGGNAAPYNVTVPSTTTLPLSFFLPGLVAGSSGTNLPFGRVCTNFNTSADVCGGTFQTFPLPGIGPDTTGGNINGTGGFPNYAGHAYHIPAYIAWKNLPVDPTYQGTFTITGHSNTSGTETLTISGTWPTTPGHPTPNFPSGEFTLTGTGCDGTYMMTFSAASSVSFALPSDTCSGSGTLKWPNFRIFNENVFQADTTPQAATPQYTPLPGGYTDTTVSRPPNTALPNFPWGSATITPTATIMDNTPGATICYTTNGTPPTATTPGTCDALAGEVSVPAGSYPCSSTSSASGCAGSAAGYSQFQVPQSALAAVPVNHVNTTIKAIATAVGYTNSAENDATYIIDAACTAPTIVGSVTATTGLDANLVPPVNDGLAFITLSFTTNQPTNAQYEIGGINVHTPYKVSGVQDAAGATSHTFTFPGLLPATINWGYGVTASTVIQSGGNTGKVCGSGSQVGLTTAYTSGSGTIIAATPARGDTTTSPATSYRVPVRGSHHVTAGYSAYFAVDFVMVAGINPPNGSLTMTITGEPTTGTSFNWMSVGTKATSTGCTNQGIFSTDGGDVLTQSAGGVCNDTNKLNTFISGVLPGREIQFLTSPTTPPGTYNLNLTMSGTGCTAACNTAASTSWQIIVDPPTAPFGVSTPKQAPASFPAIPNQVVYTNRITEYGQNYLQCMQEGTNEGNNVIRPNDNSNLLTVGSVQNGSWYYDGANAWFTADSLRQNWAGDGPAGTQLSWSQCRQDLAEMYRDNGVLAGFGGFTNTTFSQGYHDDYLIGGGLGGKNLDLQEVTTMVTTPQSPFGAANANYMDIDLRAVGYNMRSYIHGVHLGLDQPQPITQISGTGATGPFSLTFTTPLFSTTPPGWWPFAKKTQGSQPIVVTTSTGSVEPAVYNTTWLTDQDSGAFTTASFQVVANMPSCGVPTSANCGQAYIAPSSAGWGINSQGSTTGVTPMRAFLDYNLDHVLSQMEQACITQDPKQQNWELFFLGTSSRELIEYYNLITPDPRIPPIIKTCADFLWTQFQKQPTNVGTWFYVQATQFDGSNLQTQGGTNCNSPEDALNVPIYSWLYNYYGLPIYQQEGDYLFGLNATFSTGNDVLANGIFAQLPGGCYNYDGPHSIMGIGGGPTGKNFSQGLYWGPQLNYVTARNPQFNIFPGSVGVFNVTQGQPSSAQIITLSNPVNPGVAASKVIGNATVTGTDAARFVLTQTGCGNTTLAIGSTCTMSIVFTPTAGTTVVTAYGGTPIAPNTFLNIPVGASTYKVPLYGTGVNGYTAQPTLLPLPGSYGGTQSVQFTSQAGAQICLATSNGNLSTGNGNIVGTGGGTCFNGITSIPSGGTESVAANTTFIRTVATAPGYANSIGLPPQTFTITSVPTATVTPNPLNFPSTNINTTSAAMAVTITNTGSLAVVVTQAQVFSTNFTLVNGTCFTQFGSNTSFTLPVGGSCTWGITFSPTATISYVGGCPSTNCFQVTDNAQGSPQTVNLNGTGTQATIVWSSPQGGTTYNYGNIVVGNFTDSNPLTLHNTGTGPLNVNVIISGTGYSITSSTCPGTLAAGSSCTYVIRFTPPSVASFPGSLTETDSLASNSPKSLTLAGAGVNPPTQQVAPAPWVIIARRKGR